MRIAFVTQDDVFYLPQFFSQLLSEWASETVAMIVLSPSRSLKISVVRMYTLYGPVQFVLTSGRYVVRKVLSRFGQWRSQWRVLCVEGAARRYGIPVYRPSSVNDPAFIGQLRQTVRPDVIVSVAASQLFREELLALPRLGCVNVHGALLPKYRGMLPSFWTLLNGEREGGVTVHYMTAGLDDGPIIAQRRFNILPGDTVDTLIRRSKTMGAELLSDVLKGLKRGPVTTYRPSSGNGSSYNSFPTRKDVARLRASGRRVT